ncbi:type II secretion system protein [Estrella lausannensis]|uniref:Putative general secretion pathway protein G n=1 Tax=Estrella lausannensis TaxID=483423 RepID=A0A0H5DPL0_9BACT|nr:general secretion pathway protein GspG [Estrella lausannensis]CRX37414.1 Putative general secretion pathway protein G [Estrella lausannensis]
MSSSLFKKKLYKQTKRCITLVEMMVVIFIIGLIVSVIGFRYQGGLEKGKAFKTETSIDKVETILNLQVAEKPQLLDNIEKDWKEIIRKDSLVKDPEALIKDGWGDDLEVDLDDNKAIRVKSKNLDAYKSKNK